MRYTEEEQFVRRIASEFAENEIEPVAVEYERAGEYPRELVELAAESDLVAPLVPEEYGGPGFDLVAGLIVNEEFYKASPGLAESLTAVPFGADTILEYGTEAQKQAYVPPAANGEIVTGVAMTEPAAGSDFASIQGTAEKDGDEWVLNGEKVFISNGSVADALVVYLRTSDPEKPHRGISAFLVDTDTPGVEQTPMEGFVGPSSADHAQVFFEDVRVSEDALLGEEDEGFYQAMEFLDEQRLKVAASAIGTAQGALDLTLEYITERRQFGDPIATKQAVRHRIANLQTRIEAARELVYSTARDVEENDLDDPSKPAMAKLQATTVAEEVASEAVQLHGGYGCFEEYRVETYLRATQAPQIYEGSNEILREVIADGVIDT